MNAFADALLAELAQFATAADSNGQLDAWIAIHNEYIDETLLRLLKDTYADGDALTSNPQLAEKMTRFGLKLVNSHEDKSIKNALANWARGNWASLYEPDLAIQFYQRALPELNNCNDTLGVARIHGSLSYLFTIKGRFEEAETEHRLALPEFRRQYPIQPVYFLRLMRNYGGLLHCRGAFEDALTVHDQVISLALQHKSMSIAVVARNNRALTLGMLGRLSEVEQEFTSDRANALEQGLKMDVARIDMNLGDFYTACGRPADALRRLQLAEREFRELDNVLEAGTCGWLQGVLLQKIGAFNAAIRHLNDALSIFESHNMLTEVAKLRLRVAELMRMRGEFQTAQIALKSAERTAQLLGDQSVLLALRLEQIRLLLDMNDAEEAKAQLTELPKNISLLENAQTNLLMAQTHATLSNIPMALTHFQSAYNYATQQSERWLQQQTLIGMGRTLALQQPTLALNHLRAAATLAEETRRTLTVEELKSAFHSQVDEVYEDLILLAIANNLPMDALGYAWRAKSGAYIELMLARQSATEGDSYDEAKELAQVRQQLSTLHWAAAQESAFVSSGALADEAKQKLLQLEATLLDLRRKRLHTFAHSTTPILLFDAPERTLIQMDTDVLLEFARCKDWIVGFSTNRSGRCHAQRLISVQELGRMLTRLRLKFTNVLSLSPSARIRLAQSLSDECLPLLRQLSDKLISPLLDVLPDAVWARRLTIAPCDPLFTLPFAALFYGNTLSSTLSDQFEIEMIQSGALLGMPAEELPNLPLTSVVIGASSEQVTAVRTEAETIARILPNCRLYIDKPALDDLERMRPAPTIIHIAAHTLQKDDVPLFSGLKLTHEILTVERCFGLSLHETMLVTLSGCTTAGGMESGGQLLSLQQALFIAGARQLLSSLHAIPDEAAVGWMQQFYQYLVEGVTVPICLQRTQHMLRELPETSHPALWASFAAWRR